MDPAPCSVVLCPPAVYQDYSTYYGWLVKDAFVDLSARLKGNSKSTCINLLSPSGTQKTYLVSALQMFLVTSVLAWILPLEENLLSLDN